MEGIGRSQQSDVVLMARPVIGSHAKPPVRRSGSRTTDHPTSDWSAGPVCGTQEDGNKRPTRASSTVRTTDQANSVDRTRSRRCPPVFSIASTPGSGFTRRPIGFGSGGRGGRAEFDRATAWVRRSDSRSSGSPQSSTVSSDPLGCETGETVDSGGLQIWVTRFRPAFFEW